MRILILGGTGAMGAHLARLLAEDDLDVVVTSRKKRSRSKNILYVEGDAHDLNFLSSLLNRKWDVIVDFMIYNTKSFNERVKLLLDHTPQYIFLSSARVYASSDVPLTENSIRLLDSSSDEGFLATDEYSLTKARQEDILKNSGYSNWTVIRPYITYSEDRLQLGVLEKEEWLYRALKGRTIVFSKDIIEKTTTMTYGLDVANGIRAIIGKAEALGDVFHITQTDAFQWRDILDIYLKVLENHLTFTPKVLLCDLEQFRRVKIGEYQIRYDRLFDRKFDNTKIRQYIDTDMFKDVREGLYNCTEEFLRAPKFKNINWELEAIKDKYTKEYTPLREIIGFKKKIRYIIIRYLLR